MTDSVSVTQVAEPQIATQTFADPHLVTVASSRTEKIIDQVPIMPPLIWEDFSTSATLAKVADLVTDFRLLATSANTIADVVLNYNYTEVEPLFEINDEKLDVTTTFLLLREARQLLKSADAMADRKLCKVCGGATPKEWEQGSILQTRSDGHLVTDFASTASIMTKASELLAKGKTLLGKAGRAAKSGIQKLKVKAGAAVAAAKRKVGQAKTKLGEWKGKKTEQFKEWRAKKAEQSAEKKVVQQERMQVEARRREVAQQEQRETEAQRREEVAIMRDVYAEPVARRPISPPRQAAPVAYRPPPQASQVRPTMPIQGAARQTIPSMTPEEQQKYIASLTPQQQAAFLERIKAATQKEFDKLTKKFEKIASTTEMPVLIGPSNGTGQ